MNIDKDTQRIHLVLVIMYCLNFGIILYTTGLIGIILQEIVDTNLSRAFLESLSIMPITPPFRSLQYATLAYIEFIAVHVVTIHKKLSRFVLALCYVLEMLFCVVVMYSMGFASNAIVLLFIVNVLYNSTHTELRPPFLLLGIIAFIIFNNSVFTQFEFVSLSDYLSFCTTNIKVILQGIESGLYTCNFVIFVLFMFLLIQKEMKDSKQMREMNDELKLLNEQLEEYAILKEKMGETKERNRLAREIHDTLGHTLTGLSVGIDAATMLLNIDKEATRKQLDLLSTTARKGLEEVRRSVEKLRPDALERYTIQEAINKMILDFEKISAVKIHFVCRFEEISFGSDIDEFIYRFVQEGTTNAVRYGKADNIFVSIAEVNNKLILILEDDGVGCENIKMGFGLHHMKERVKQLCGNIQFHNEKGFCINVEIPLRQQGVLMDD